METIQAIFSQLGANASVINQFVIVAAFFFIAKVVFFNKLQFIIENRVEKTTGLESSADEMFEKANKLGEKYKQRVEAAHGKAQALTNEKRTEILAIQREKIKKTEEEVNAYVESSKNQIITDIKSKKNEIFAETSELAKMLINKLGGKH